jgi:metal-responsive CopG/Arc/MetJ family transcriptional regulator
MTRNVSRNLILGFRTTKDFTRNLDGLCERLGCHRSDLIRYALRRFVADHFNHPENFRRAKADLL